MAIRIPRPADVFDAAQSAAQTVAGLPADAARNLARVSGLLDQAEALLARTARLLDSVERTVATVEETNRSAGEVIGVADSGLIVAGGCGGSLCLGELQMEGMRRMSAGEFTRGRPIPQGSILE